MLSMSYVYILCFMSSHVFDCIYVCIPEKLTNLYFWIRARARILSVIVGWVLLYLRGSAYRPIEYEDAFKIIIASLPHNKIGRRSQVMRSIDISRTRLLSQPGMRE